MRTEFAVIGAGITGLSAAWALARRGREVVVLDQAPIGHVRGGSHGSCRIFRLGYEHQEYVTLARGARATWAELEQAAGERLLHPAPQLTFGPLMREVQAAMSAAGASFELLSAGQAAERFPGIRASGEVLLEPDSAVIAADRALAALAGLVRRSGQLAGGQLAEQRVVSLADEGDRVIIRTAAGEIQADCAIVCAGPWTAALLAAAGITIPGSATLEQVAYLVPRDSSRPGADEAGPDQATAGGSEATAGHAVPGLAMPIFVHYGGEFPYGLPVPGVSGRYKIGLHHGGPAVDPDQQVHDEDTALTGRIARAARTILPAFNPNPIAVERCVYDNSPDTDFIVDRIGNVVIGSGTSGHGFKFGPLLGEWLALLAVSSRQSPGDSPAGAPPARFAIGRF